MSTLLHDFTKMLKDIIFERNKEGSINLLTVPGGAGLVYDLRLIPKCPQCGADLQTSSGKYLLCTGASCLYGRDL